MAHKFLAVSVDEVMKFYMREALRQSLDWQDWYLDPVKNKVIFKYWESAPDIQRENDDAVGQIERLSAEVSEREKEAFLAGYKAGGEHMMAARHDVNTGYFSTDAYNDFVSTRQKSDE